MAVSMLQISLPSLTLGLTNLSAILDKAATQTAARKVDPKTVADARLIVDMFPLKKQVQIACDVAKGGAARLAGIDMPKFEDSEETLDQLKERIAKTVAFIGSIDAATLEGAETREIVLAFPNMTLKFNGLDYLTKFVLPNVYFHITVAYSILRSNGVDVGKGDYLGAIQ